MPAAPPSTVLMLTGPPGVGKSTAAALLAERYARSVHLESDAFFRFVRSGFVEPWRPESHGQNEVVMRIVRQAAAAYADAGYFTIVDGIVIPRWFVGPLREALGAAGHQVAYVVLRAPLPTCAARVEAREGVPAVEPEVIEGIWSQFTDLGEYERYVLETEGRTPAETADAIADLLATGSHAL